MVSILKVCGITHLLSRSRFVSLKIRVNQPIIILKESILFLFVCEFFYDN